MISFIYYISYVLLTGMLLCIPYNSKDHQNQMERLKVSENGRFLMKENRQPFFWLGDTGWLLFLKLNRKEAAQYLEDRHKKGFNVIQVMITYYNLSATNAYGNSPFVNGDVTQPEITKGDCFGKDDQYDYWDHVDYIINLAAKMDIYLAIVPIWGTSVRAGMVNREQVHKYAKFLAKRYKEKKNIIWVNGGDLRGSDSIEVWNILGETLDLNDPNHLITYHPIGGTNSATWFHNAAWLDFNMFQSGHLRYDQDAGGYGEDVWKYVQDDYYKKPTKPVLDGESAYEGIPQGLNDTTQPRWGAQDIRRNAYWSVFAGAFGFTYGDNAVFQMYKPTDKKSEFAPRQYWYEALDALGATQMVYLKRLMLSRPYFERIPDPSIVVNQGTFYDYIAATRGKGYIFVYTDNGRTLKVNMGVINGEKVKASWYNPRNGNMANIGVYSNRGIKEFNPPGEEQNGNDWVLILDSL